MIIFLLTLILVCLLILVTGGALMWRKVNLYLVWNTRNESLDYEKAVTTPRFKRPEKAIKTDQRGRSIKPVDDLVDLGDLDFETAAKAIEEAGM
jgi:hypothetical protein